MDDLVAFDEGFARVIDIAHHFDEPAYRALMDEVMGKVAQRPDNIVLSTSGSDKCDDRHDLHPSII